MNREKIKNIIKELYPYVVIVVVVVLFRTFIATPVRVDGSSMDSTLKNGDILILNKLDKNYERFDVVVVNITMDGETSKLVKRIIGMPGESIEYKENDLYIDGKIVKDMAPERTNDFTLKQLYDLENIPENTYFVMGDNRSDSRDSRDYTVGLIKKEDIVGTTTIRLFPFNKIGKFN